MNQNLEIIEKLKSGNGDLCQESGHILEGVFINLGCFQTELEIKS